MLNRDYPFLLAELEKRVDAIERKISLKANQEIDNNDWDNATLMMKWQISQRTTANYRKQGLEYYKVGGRIYYNAEQRKQFVSKTTKVRFNNKQIEEVESE